MTKRKHTPKPSPWRSGTNEHAKIQARRAARARAEAYTFGEPVEDRSEIDDLLSQVIHGYRGPR